MTQPAADHRDMQQCIQNCRDCQRACMLAIAYCLERGGEYTQSGRVRILMDCAEICQTSANFMLRVSELHPYTCAVCAQVCDRCAKQCQGLEADPQMRFCAEICQRCADSCNFMAEAVV